MKKNSVYTKLIHFVANQKGYVLEIFKILFFGFLSLLMGQIQFVMPGVEGSLSDLREIALIIGVFYFRHWIPVVFVSFITAFGTPADGSIFATFCMHLVALSAIYYAFQYLSKQALNRFVLSGIWLLVGVAYFYLFLIPTMVIVYSFVGLIQENELMSNYLNIIEIIRFEMVSTTAVSALFLLNLKATEVLEKQNTELVVSMQKSEESEKLKTAFLQNLSHEIRTPMNGILGFSRLLQGIESEDKDINRYTQQIIDSGDQLLNIVNDIIDVSQIETLQVSPILSENLLGSLIKDIIDVFKVRTELNHFRIVTSINCPEDIVIKTDFYKVSRSIYHLIDNALKFSIDMPVELDVNYSGGNLEVSVKDYGIGIAAGKQALIFEGFRQLDNDLKRSYGGNGLGLTIAKGFTNALQGEIWLQSELGKGSTFSISIPA